VSILLHLLILMVDLEVVLEVVLEVDLVVLEVLEVDLVEVVVLTAANLLYVHMYRPQKYPGLMRKL
jgi:hypothetical protein